MSACPRQSKAASRLSRTTSWPTTHAADLFPQSLAGLAQLGDGLDIVVARFRWLLLVRNRHGSDCLVSRLKCLTLVETPCINGIM